MEEVIRSRMWESYVHEYAKAEENGWTNELHEELLNLYETSDEHFPTNYILIHPNWYSPNTKENSKCDIRDGNTWGPLEPKEKCQAEKYWGYPCPITASDRDHIFPRSLGGPSVPQNCIPLCKWHNSMRSFDPHVIANPEEKPQWFDAILGTIKRKLH